MKAVVVYHANCLDGFTAAWVFHTLAEKDYTEGVTYVPASYGDPLPEFPAGPCNLYILDFFYSRSQLEQLCRVFNKVLLLDHHKTAIDTISPEVWPPGQWPDNLEMALDMNRSGAGIPWDWFSGESVGRSKLVNYIEDRDLWRFNLPFSKEVSAYIKRQKMDFNSWDILEEDLLWNFATVVNSGSILLKERDSLIKEIAAEPRKMEIFWLDGVKRVMAHCINCPPGFSSEVGNYIVTNYGTVGVTYSQNSKGTTKFSLRSRNDLEDVAKIAEAFGGGGHRNAAGFTLKEPKQSEILILAAANFLNY